MRRQRFFVSFLTSVILILTLLGFFVDADGLLRIQWVFVNWAVIIAACAIILGFGNVLTVHIGKLAGRSAGWFYSAALIISAVIVLILGLGDILYHEDGLWGPFMAPIFVWVIAPLQAATASLLLFVLTYAAYRMLRRDGQRDVFLFLISASVVLVSQISLPTLGIGLEDLRDIWLSWLVIPGLRAVLIGVVLGIAMTALRLIMGIDRPQG